MNSHRPMSRTALLFVVTTVLGLALVGPETSSAASSQELPFHAAFQGNANPSPIGQCTLDNRETGSGLALHLGEWTWSDIETVRFLSCPPAGSAIAVSGQFTMVSANGDQINGTFETTGTFDPVNGVAVQGGYTFTSGTGRFTNVSGSGVIAAHGVAAPPFDFVASMNGTISSIGR